MKQFQREEERLNIVLKWLAPNECASLCLIADIHRALKKLAHEPENRKGYKWGLERKSERCSCPTGLKDPSQQTLV